MTPEQAIREASEGRLRPVYLLLGEELYFAAEALEAIARASETGPTKGFNQEKFVAGEADVDTLLAAARTVPMMAPRRLIVVSSLERWDRPAGAAALDQLDAYARDPVPSTVLVLLASKLHGSRKLVRQAKKDGFVVSCQTLPRRDLPAWIRRRSSDLGHPLEGDAAEALAELVGPELGPVADALERLSLYVGPKAPITEAALAAVVTRVRQETVWNLVDALGERNLGGALAALRDAYDARDAGLPLLGAIGWRVRQLLKVQGVLRRGGSPGDAAKEAGVPSFRIGETARAARAIEPRTLEHWLLLLAEADLALKGSRRGGDDVVATMLVDMCRA
jgi:DNA polymerase-3 subunit delta